MAEQDLTNVLNDAIDRLAAGDTVDAIVADSGRFADQLRPMLEAGLLTRRAKYPPLDTRPALDRIDSRVLPTLNAPPGWVPPWMILPFVLILGLGAVVIGVLFMQQAALPSQVTETATQIPETKTHTPIAEPSESPTARITESLIATVPSLTAVVSVQLSGPLIQSETGDYVINGLVLTIDDSLLPPDFQPGGIVSVSGTLNDGRMIVETLLSPTPTNVPPTDITPMITATSAPPSSTPAQTIGRVIIEGPVEQIKGNTVIIFEQEVVIDPLSPLLSVIQIGDVLRLEGEIDAQGQWVIVTIMFVSVDVVISAEGLVWRDSGTCEPPPDWARSTARNWTTRCETSSGGQSQSGSSGGNSEGDDDD